MKSSQGEMSKQLLNNERVYKGLSWFSRLVFLSEDKVLPWFKKLMDEHSQWKLGDLRGV